eukprot:1564197-Amphidinium_carterae.1
MPRLQFPTAQASDAVHMRRPPAAGKLAARIAPATTLQGSKFDHSWSPCFGAVLVMPRGLCRP